MKVFILEDDPTRVMWLRDRLIGHEVTVIDSCQRINEYHNDKPYDILLLDHDLGGRQLEENEDCGATFCKMLTDDGGNGDPYVIVHSYNPDGAREMIDILTDDITTLVYAPFRGPMFCNTLDNILRDGRSCYEPR